MILFFSYISPICGCALFSNFIFFIFSCHIELFKNFSFIKTSLLFNSLITLNKWNKIYDI